jgi:hypothetical protein
MSSFGSRRYAFSIGAAAALLAACGGSQTQPSQNFCILTVPWVQLLYPIPGSKGVPTNVGQMVFASTGVTRIELGVDPYPYGGEIRTKREPPPNPLPSPIATPGPYYVKYLTTRFAVSFAKLQPKTRYTARAWVAQSACSLNIWVGPTWTEIGSFLTE